MTGGEDREAKRVAFLRGLAARRTCRHAQLLGVKGCRPTSVDTPADAPVPWGAVVQRDGRREVRDRLPAGLARLSGSTTKPQPRARPVSRSVVALLATALYTWIIPAAVRAAPCASPLCPSVRTPAEPSILPPLCTSLSPKRSAMKSVG